MSRPDRFELGAELGRGGMGRVVRAHDRALGREVALKLVRIDAKRPERLERFRREGELAARLDHAGIVRVHSSGVEGNEAWLAMELVEGARPLEQAFQGAARERRVAWVIEAARALGHAHRRGVVHRDVKPENVLVDREGRVRVTDFGLAHAVGLDRLTRDGQVVGTPLFFSPEALEGREVGPPADVWGLGVLLYQALTGELPFEGRTLAELAVQITSAALVPPRARDPSVPAALERVCLAALRREPAARPADGEALAELILEALQDRGGPGFARALVPLALFGAGALGGMLLFAGSRPADEGGGAVAAAPASGPPAVAASRVATPVPPAPGSRTSWALPEGARATSQLRFMLDRRSEGEVEMMLTYRIEVDLEERALPSDPGFQRLELTIRGLRVDTTGRLPFNLDVATAEADHPLRRLFGEAFLVTVSGDGKVVSSGLDLLHRGLVGQGANFPKVLETALDPLQDHVMAPRLELLWQQAPGGATDGASWPFKSPLWVWEDECHVFEGTSALAGDTVLARSMRARARGQRAETKPLGRPRLMVATRWEGGRVVSARAELEAEERWPGGDRSASRLEWALGYEATPR